MPHHWVDNVVDDRSQLFHALFDFFDDVVCEQIIKVLDELADLRASLLHLCPESSTGVQFMDDSSQVFKHLNDVFFELFEVVFDTWVGRKANSKQ